MNFTVIVPTSLVTEQVYCPASALVTALIVRTLPPEGGGIADGSVQVYEGLGFPTVEQFRCRGFPSVTVTGRRRDDP